MTSILSLDELKTKLGAAPDATRRRWYFAAILREEAAVPVDDFLVVGGSAIEIYTVGQYTSGDIDIISSERKRIGAVLRAWEFANRGRIWESDELQIVVDLVKGPYTGSLGHTTLGTTPYGPIRLAAIEDLLVKRLSTYKHWKAKGDFAHAVLLALEFGDRIDWGYVTTFANENDVGELVDDVRSAIAKKKSKNRK